MNSINIFFSLLFIIGFSFAIKNSYADTSIESLPVTKEIDYLNKERLPASKSKQTILDIINSKDLKGEKNTTEWRFKTFDLDKPDNGTSKWIKSISIIFATLFEYTLWILLLIAILSLYFSREYWLHFFSAQTKDKKEYQAPEVLFGMDVREQSLPEDIIEEAKYLWQQKKAREALSLLYRGGLVRLINQEKIPLENHHTEGDILKLSKLSLTANKQQYLQQLTSQWQLIAYAHRIPMDEAMDWLFAHWHSDFAYQTDASTEVKV